MANKISSTLYVVHTFVHCILHRYLFYCKVFTKGISSEICTHSIRIYFSDCIVHCTHWNVDYLIYEMVYLECDDEYDEEQDKSDVHCGWFFCLPEKGLIRGLGRRMQIDYQLPIHPKYTLGKYKNHWKPPKIAKTHQKTTPKKGLIRGPGRRMQIDYQLPIHTKFGPEIPKKNLGITWHTILNWKLIWKKDFVILFFGERVELLCFMTITSVLQPFPFPHIWWRGRGEFKIKDSDR